MITALIPARYHSKRILQKNMRTFIDRPLAFWSYAVASQVPSIEAVYFSSDSREWCGIAEGWGCIPLLRPEALATSIAGDFHVVRHFFESVPNVDLCVYLRPTTPLRRVMDVDGAIKLFILSPNLTGLRSVEEMGESAYKCFELNHGLLEPMIGSNWGITDTPNQSLTKTYHPNGVVDLIRRSTVESGKLWGNMVHGYLTPRTVELDTEEDWKYAEWTARREDVYEFTYEKGRLKTTSLDRGDRL